MIDSLNIWYGRIGHVHISRKCNLLILFLKLVMHGWTKCEILVKSNLRKKLVFLGKEKQNCLNLINTDLGDLKESMIRGGKKYYVTSLDDYSRYKTVYLLK